MSYSLLLFRRGTSFGLEMIFCMFAVASGNDLNAQPHTLPELTRAIHTTLDAVAGTVAVAFRNLEVPDEHLLINAHEQFHAASTMKTPVMVELYRQAQNGRISLDDSVRVENEFRSIVDGSGYSLSRTEDSYDELYEHLGEKRPIRTLMRKMITASSNLATNLLIEKVGADRVTNTMRRYGAEHIEVRRCVEDMKAYRQGLNNVTSAHDLLVLFERLARREAVSEQASDEMIGILQQQEYNDILPAPLPDSVAVAHKTGWISGVRHDAGIVSGPERPTYVLVLLSKNLEDPEAGVDALGRISGLIFSFVTDAT